MEGAACDRRNGEKPISRGGTGDRHGGPLGERTGHEHSPLGGVAGKGLRDLAGDHLGRILGAGVAGRPRSAGPGGGSGRSGLHPLRGPSRVGDSGYGHGGGARCNRGSLSHQSHRRGPVFAFRFRGGRPLGGRSGAGGQTDGGDRHPPPFAESHLCRATGVPLLSRRSPIHLLGGVLGVGSAAPGGEPGGSGAADGRGPTRRCDDPGLHLGHHRSPQGGDAGQRQHRVLLSGTHRGRRAHAGECGA